MKEIEVKILGIDPAETERKLTALGAQVSFDGELSAVFFDMPGGTLAQQGKVVRLRREGNAVKLTFKQKSAGGASYVKSMDEFEITVSDFSTAEQILTGMGYTPYNRISKHRRQFDFGNCHAVIDTYTGEHAYIPPFLEIEAPDEPSLESFVSQLGYSSQDCLPWNTFDLIRYYGDRSPS